MRTSRRLLAVTAVGASALLTACGGGGGSITLVRGDAAPDGGSTAQVTLASLQAAGTTTAEATSGRFSSAIALGDGSTFSTTEGEFTGGRTRARTTMDFAAMGSAFGADEELPAELGDGSFDSEVVTDGATAYLRGGLLAEMTSMFGIDVPEGGWLRVTGDDSSLGSEMGVGAFSTDTTQLLDGAFGEVTLVGTEEVRDVTTTHSRVAIDPSKVVGEIADELPGIDSGTFTADVWVDADGLVRRLRFEVDPGTMFDFGDPDGGGTSDGGAEGEGGFAMVMTFEMWDLNEPIDIDVPSGDQVVDVPNPFGN